MSDDYILVTVTGCEGSSSHQQATRHTHWLAGRAPVSADQSKVSRRETAVISNKREVLIEQESEATPTSEQSS